MEIVRVGTLQYLIRPVHSFQEFQAQVCGLIATAADYGCRLLIFPEYFSLQLLTLGEIERPMSQQVHELAAAAPRILEMMAAESRRRDLYVVAGSVLEQNAESGHLNNVSYLLSPDGTRGRQPKIHMTRFERDEWDVEGQRELTTFETDFGRLGICVCYDVEFPELAREHARNGAELLAVPSCTDDRQAFLRVRFCAQARAIENQIYVSQASTVGSLPNIPAVSLNYGQASILTPSDFAFSRDGVAAEGIPNQEAMVIADLNLEVLGASRAMGTVLPLIDAERNRGRVPSSRVARLGPPGRQDFLVRALQREDFPAVIALCRKVYTSSPPWTQAQLESHLTVFPEGQLVAVRAADRQVVGYAASLILRWNDYAIEGSWRDFTEKGTFANHEPVHGRTLYGAEVMVDPDLQGHGIGTLLYEARNDLVTRLKLLRIRAGARLRGYGQAAGELTPDQYVLKVCRGELHDPTLSFQLGRGFRVLAVVSGYLAHDPESQGFAAIIEWLNPDVATAQDYAEQPERFRPAAVMSAAHG